MQTRHEDKYQLAGNDHQERTSREEIEVDSWGECRLISWIFHLKGINKAYA